MKTSDFDYELPEELIAQTPVEPRDQSRLLVYRRKDQSIEHKHFFDIIDYLNPGDALVINETRVIPARLLGVKEDTGVPVEVLLLRRLSTAEWEALVRPGRRLKPGTRCVFGNGLLACEILGNVEEIGGRTVRFIYDGVFEEILDRLGEMPLPPYIHEKLKDRDRYQTVYAKQDGSAAAPTAGLHFTPELLDRIRQKGITVVPVLLHVGLGTFRPVKVEDAEKHVMHSEFCRVTQEAARRRRTDCLCRHHLRPDPRDLLPGGWHNRSGSRGYGHLHLPRREAEGGGRSDHQFPPAPEHAAHAGQRADGPGGSASCLPHRRGGALPLLPLRRRHVY